MHSWNNSICKTIFKNKNGFLRSGWTILIVMLLYYAQLYAGLSIGGVVRRRPCRILAAPRYCFNFNLVIRLYIGGLCRGGAEPRVHHGCTPQMP